MLEKFKGLLTEEEGQGMAEYALVLGVIAIAVVAILVTFGEAIVDQFQEVIDNFTSSEEG
ncbi:Flp family type IVb pilin [Evansella tamaricis]|uniref:Flp family type IVb pilin n=1 Tax=Evansella tamaricis TaxID=2069301 RepID=A0ABS6JNM4_9BACI|nr:Flp family type IVb pilin [Evansella tamaricis]MBU9714005.1 Flp family type IVb pilin [Evansella tamaricis]